MINNENLDTRKVSRAGKERREKKSISFLQRPNDILINIKAQGMPSPICDPHTYK
jgi:hypothetical protein